jgi:hypothetical protein
VTVSILVLSSAACVQVFDARTLGARTTLSAPATEQPQGEPFSITKTAVYAFWGIAAASRPSLERVLSTQVSGEAEVANLRITQRSRFSDILVTVLTGGIIVPRSITYEGVVVRPAAGSTGQ